MALGQRVRQRRLELKLSQTDLAEKIKATQTYVQSLESRDSKKTSRINELVIALSTTHKWLSTGEGKKSASIRETVMDYNTSSAPDIKGLVPLISEVQAGEWAEAIDQFQPGEAESTLPCVASHGIHTYALRVSGDSMTAPYGKSYPDGCIIFVDPEQVAVSGDRVIAKVKGENGVTFKQYIEEGTKRYLRPLNPSLLPIEDEFRIIGKVIGKWEDE
jgi:SOS-response transcriptional repressor LexA